MSEMDGLHEVLENVIEYKHNVYRHDRTANVINSKSLRASNTWDHLVTLSSRRYMQDKVKQAWFIPSEYYGQRIRPGIFLLTLSIFG
jgi:hypothetical protein